MTVLLLRLKYMLFILLFCFFLIFGVHLLIAAYRSNNPLWFIMTFFSSNLIILISAALLVGFFIRLKRTWTDLDEAPPNDQHPGD